MGAALMGPDARSVIQRALRGDRDAFEMLIRTYSRLVYAHVYSILPRPGEAEDIVQETFLKAYRSLRRVKDPEKFPSWICSIARNLAKDSLKRHKPVSLPDGMEEIEDDMVEKPDCQLEGLELKERIHRSLSELPEHHRLAVTLRYLEGMDCRGIEQSMGITNGKLRGILGRAMETLRTSLQPVIFPVDS